MRLMRDLVGDVLSDRYRLSARIAGGGMGEVYRGHDMLLDRVVAVKVLQPSLAADAELVTRFKLEARAAARLTHPNVVAVHDWGAADELTYYMVMEYVRGSDLRDLLVSRGGLDPGHCVTIMISVCDALAAAHSVGLVHRDIKPENILIAQDGTVKVADFGIAVVVDADRTNPGGGIPGTLRYLSPEQARGDVATPASDIWAAGAVLAETLTGRPPQFGSGIDLLTRRATEAPIPPSTFDPRVPRALDEIVMRTCALDPLERHASASAFAAELRAVAARLPEAPSLEVLLDDVTGEVMVSDIDPTTMFSRRDLKETRGGRRGALKLVSLVLVLAVLGFGGSRAALAVFGPREVEVPSLLGLRIDAAEDRAEDLGLSVRVSPRRKHSRAPEGEVLGQWPPEGPVEEGSTITLFVSAGLPSHPVPPVVGLPLAKATKRIEARGFELGRVTKRHSGDVPTGSLIAQKPAGGPLLWGSEIHVVVSKGPRPVKIPDVVGTPSEDAVAALEKAGLVVSVVEVHHEKVEAGLVIATTPRAGILVPRGEGVTIEVSKGRKLAKFKMPDVRGEPVERARATLERMGLVVRVEQACGGGSVVVDTDPIAGQRVTEGDRVALFVC